MPTTPSDPIESFPPIARADARVLILGSIPSVRSLALQEYYGHERNAFWPLMARLFGFDRDAPYAERCARLVDARVAVWDVLQACVRPGSLDSAIQRDTERPNDLRDFLEQHAGITKVAFNGRKAEETWRRHVERGQSESQVALPPTLVLPSTSPAMASLDFEGKLAAWCAVAPLHVALPLR